MDKFLAKTRSRSRSFTRKITSEGATSKMAPHTSNSALEASEATEVMPRPVSRHPQQSNPPNPVQPATLPSDSTLDYALMAQAVAEILKPTVVDAVEQAIEHSLAKLQTAVQAHDDRLDETEQHISTLEEELMEVHSGNNKTDTTIQMLLDKVDDLENRSRRNNLRIVGVLEMVKPIDLQKLCEEIIPQAMGMTKRVTVERDQRLGAPQPDRRGLGQVIARYLNFNDKNTILQKFPVKRELVIDGQHLLLFLNYSAEVSKRRKMFSKICSTLYLRKITFTLAYPATLHLVVPDGKQYSFQNVEEVESFLA